MRRREFLAGCGLALAGSILRATRKDAPTILLRSSWQTINIGDIAHTPGVLALLEKHLPGAGVILWPGRLDRGVEPMLRRRFPRLRLVRAVGSWRSESPRPDDPTVEQAIEQADLMMHGSGPSLVARKDLDRWARETKKPYGAYGITLTIEGTGEEAVAPELRRLLEGAAFLYTRETRTLEALRQARVRCPDMQFAPDGTFACDLRDDAAAEKLLRQNALEKGRFLCAVPRLRYTPYWKLHPNPRVWTPERIRERQAENDKHAEKDHARLREVITAWVRKTGQKVLLCPEMTYQVDILRPLLRDPLPDDVKERVAALDRYWLTDEAASVYRQASLVVSMECHSPLLAYANGTPAFYVRQPTDTWKGQMYPDVGLGRWKLEVEEVTGAEIAARALEVHGQPDAARTLLEQAMARVGERHTRTMANVGKVLGQVRP